MINSMPTVSAAGIDNWKAIISPPPRGYSSDSLELRARNVKLLDSVRDIFDLPSNLKGCDFRLKVLPGHVTDLYWVINYLFPKHVPVERLLPAPSGELRALFLGDYDPTRIKRDLIHNSLYADQTLIVAPFLHPWAMNPEYCPIANPEAYVSSTVQLVHFFLTVEPWVRAGFATIIPNVNLYDPLLRKRTMEMAQVRLKNAHFDDAEIRSLFSSQRTKASVLYHYADMPKELAVPRLNAILGNGFGISGEDLHNNLVAQRDNDPFYPIGHSLTGKGEIQTTQLGGNLETSYYLCAVCGCFPMTNIALRWREILAANVEYSETERMWAAFSRAFKEKEFSFLDNVEVSRAVDLRGEGRLSSFRTFLRDIWNKANMTGLSETDIVALKDRLVDEHEKAKVEWQAIDRSLLKAVMNSASALVPAIAYGEMSFTFGGFSLIAAAIQQLIHSHWKRQDFRTKVPMSLFIDLNRK